ncbi:MAG: hypothetical protein H7333_02195 [Bdellovibrionales bacterium]|nr:hypothetical protein [Oligoflexia bacterium]
MASSCILLALTACGNGPYDLENKTDRDALKFEVKQALTQNDCTKALTLVTPLYQSKYTDNDVRMFYASAHACNVGIRLYSLLDDLTSADMSNQIQIFRSFVRLFPSSTTDSKMASSWFALDALQSILLPGAVIANADQINPTTLNMGSVLSHDRTLDANTYMVFIGMSVVGTGLNRYGFLPNEVPAATSYAKTQALPWTTKVAVQSDTSGAACSIVSGLYNMFDGITSIVTLLTSGPSGALSNINSNLQLGLNAIGSANCTGTDGGYTAAQCAAAATRIRFRGACAEQGPAAAFAAGVIQGINLGWL